MAGTAGAQGAARRLARATAHYRGGREWRRHRRPRAQTDLLRKRDNGLEPPKTLESYCLRALVREPVRREKGRVWYDGWLRNIGISVLVAATKLQFGLNPTRNREARRRQQPSACSLVATALGRHSINIEEKRVENLWAQYQGFVLSYLVGRFGV